MDFLWQLLKKVLAWLQGSPSLLGLALTLAFLGYYRSRNNNNDNNNDR